MTYTARTVIQDALELIKIYAPGVTVTSADAARMLALMNNMLDEWSNESLTCYANTEQSFTLVPGVNQYTIGAGGSINVIRPLDINTGSGAAYLIDSNGIRFPIEIIQQDQWNNIGLLTVTSQLPDTMFYDPQYPLAIINIFPTPSIAYQVYFDSRLQLSDMPTLDTAFSLPPGYMSAITNNLGIRAWPYFKQGDPTAYLMKMAADSLAAIKRTNIKRTPSTYDSAVVSKAQSSYNIFSDNFGRSDK